MNILKGNRWILFFVISLGSLFSQKMSVAMRVIDINLLEAAPRSVYVQEVREWKSGQTVLWVNAEVKKDIPFPDFKMIAYFYDENNVVIHKMTEITSGHRRTPSGGWDSLFKTPSGFKKNETYELHFLIPKTVKADLIKRSVFVYGVDKNWAWRAYPGTTLDAIEFDEKAQIVEAGEASEN